MLPSLGQLLSPLSQLFSSTCITNVHVNDFIRALAYLALPTASFYLSLYARLKSRNHVSNVLGGVTLLGGWLAPWVTPVLCPTTESLRRLASMQKITGECCSASPISPKPSRTTVVVAANLLPLVVVGTMKLVDLTFRESLPTYTSVPPSRSTTEIKPQSECVPPRARPDKHFSQPDWKVALLLLTELRYESFTPSPLRRRHPPPPPRYAEKQLLGMHVLAFCGFQLLPQDYSAVMALEVMLAIYIVWTSLQLCLRYPSSPPLFGPLYAAEDLGSFW
jgi:hypothetical protein